VRALLKDLKGIHNIHFVGIGGAGMSPLAKILLLLGYNVSGSDQGTSPIIEELVRLGARVWTDGQRAENVRGADAIVVSTAIPYDNPEVIAAWDLRIPKLHRSDINAALVNEYDGIAVAGSHGKTTTTSMIGVTLDRVGVSPTIIVGGEVPDLGTNAKRGTSRYLVSEADESDGSFLKLRPHVAVVTNVEDDHMDHYGTMEKIIAAFRTFIDQVDEDGTAILCFENEILRKLAAETKRCVISYAIDTEADYRAADIEAHGSIISFTVFERGVELGRVSLNIPGRHNVLNALACIAVARLAGVAFAQIQDALAGFHGAKRRFQTKGKEHGVWVVDDYAHHPTEIAVTLTAARATNPGRLICVFQPHRYSRTNLLRTEFGACFAAADLLILTDVYAAGETPIPGVSGETLMEEVAKQTGQDAVYLPERVDLERYLAQHVRAGDLVITMGAGNILEVGETLVEQLKNGTAGTGERPIVVVMGGPSTEAEVSRRSGTAILEALRTKAYPVIGMELVPTTFAEEIQKLNPAIVFNALHGKYGEDGILQGTLDMLGIPYTGSGVRAAALTMDKVTAKRIFCAEGIATPRFCCISKAERDVYTAERIRTEFDLPVVVKAPEQGSSIGVYIVTREEDLQSAIDEAFSYGNEVLIEEFIEGRELTVAVWGIPADAQALPVIEITTTSGRYDYESKYTPGASAHIVPAELSPECTAAVQELAVRAFKACGCTGVARIDVMLSTAGEPYAIEVNAVPGMTATSLVPDAARAVGIEFPALCEKILAMAGYTR
jgi:hypothetical protein